MKIKTGIATALVLALAIAAPAVAQQFGGRHLSVMSDRSVSASKLIGDYLGVGKKMVSVPLSHVNLDATKATMAGTKAEMMAMPAWSVLQGGGG